MICKTRHDWVKNGDGDGVIKTSGGRKVAAATDPGGGAERWTCRSKDLPVPTGDVFNCSQITTQSAIGFSVDISPNPRLQRNDNR